MPDRDDSNFFSEEEYDENFMDRNDEDEQNFVNKNEALYSLEINHLENRLNREVSVAILQEAVKIASTSFFWKFKTLKGRINTVLDIYYVLFGHVNVNEDD